MTTISTYSICSLRIGNMLRIASGGGYYYPFVKRLRGYWRIIAAEFGWLRKELRDLVCVRMHAHSLL